jgi:hypothetical protein
MGKVWEIVSPARFGLIVIVIVPVVVTVKFTPLLAAPLTVTTTFPVVAPVGTGTTMLVALQLVGVPAVPLNFTVLVPCVAPKFVPVIVTEVATNPEFGLSVVMVGAGIVTVKFAPLLATPPTVTTTFPVVAPVGTGTTMLVALQLVGVPAVPLNFTVLVPCVAPKLVPVIVTEVPTGPDVGLRLVMLGTADVTVKLTPLLATPPIVTTTFPVVAPLGTVTIMLVALQPVGAAGAPLKVTVLVPCVVPKLVPLIVTDVPTMPDVTLSAVMRMLVPGSDPPLALEAQPCSTLRVATNRVSVSKIRCKVVLMRSLMFKFLPREKHSDSRRSTA